MEFLKGLRLCDLENSTLGEASWALRSWGPFCKEKMEVSFSVVSKDRPQGGSNKVTVILIVWY